MGDNLYFDPNMALVKPFFHPSQDPETPRVTALIQALSLSPHIEGGYFYQTDSNLAIIPSPYPHEPLSRETLSIAGVGSLSHDALAIRCLSTTIFYYLTPRRPQGYFHRNRSRIVHSLHRGRGRYVLLHPDGSVETFVVGSAVERGEKLQWVVEGGVYKASFLLDEPGDAENEGLLITETVSPGFNYADHEFLTQERLQELLPEESARQLGWLVNHHAKHQEQSRSHVASEGTEHDDDAYGS